jgi:hypothetical protein
MLQADGLPGRHVWSLHDADYCVRYHSQTSAMSQGAAVVELQTVPILKIRAGQSLLLPGPVCQQTWQNKVQPLSVSSTYQTV